MKKTLSVLGTVATALVVTYSCMPKAGLPIFGTVTESETIRQDKNEFELDYRFEYISDYGDKDVLQKVQRSMTADFFGDDYVKDTPVASAQAYHESMAAEFRSEVTEFQQSFPEAYPWNWFHKIRSHTHVLNERILVYTVEDSYFMGGAHGLETIVYSNYDLYTGDKLTLDDLFTPEGKAALAERIHAQILKDRNAKDWDALMDETCYYAKEEIEPTDNFELTDTHIAFMYNPYDIGCYAQGRTRVKLPLAELAGFKKEAIEK